MDLKKTYTLDEQIVCISLIAEKSVKTSLKSWLILRMGEVFNDKSNTYD